MSDGVGRQRDDAAGGVDRRGAGVVPAVPRVFAVRGDDLDGDAGGRERERAERFSFALAVVLTPPAVGREVLRLVKATHEARRRVLRSTCMEAW